MPDTGDDEEASDSEEDTDVDSQKGDGSVEENRSLEEDNGGRDEGDDEVDKLKFEVADLKAALRNKCAKTEYDAALKQKSQDERSAMCSDCAHLELKILDLQSKLARSLST